MNTSKFTSNDTMKKINSDGHMKILITATSSANIAQSTNASHINLPMMSKEELPSSSYYDVTQKNSCTCSSRKNKQLT